MKRCQYEHIESCSYGEVADQIAGKRTRLDKRLLSETLSSVWSTTAIVALHEQGRLNLKQYS